MKMMSIYIIYSWVEHLQDYEDGMEDGVGWLGGRWVVTLYFLSIVKFSCACCIRRCGGLPIYKRDGNSRISRIDCLSYKLRSNLKSLHNL